jgi:hypothetical protein
MGMQARSKPTPTLLGRQREREALDGLIEDLRSGHGWAPGGSARLKPSTQSGVQH